MKSSKTPCKKNLLGITINKRLTSKLTWKKVCIKAEQKLHALERIANYMDIIKKQH